VSSIVASHRLSLKSPALSVEGEFVWGIDRIVCWLLVFAVTFVNGADFRGGTGEEFTVHWQIYLRLLVAFASGCAGLLLLPSKTLKDFWTWPGFLVSAYVIWYGATLVTSVDKAYSSAAWASLLGVILLIPAAMRVLGGYHFWLAVTWGLAVYLIGSWIAYLYFPEIGLFQEQVTQTDVFERMGGLGHPNELGYYAAYMILAFVGLSVSGRIGMGWAALGMALGAVTLLSCFSRTAIITCTIGVIFALRGPLMRPGNLFAAVIATALGTIILFAAVGTGELDWTIESSIADVTKSGTTDELATVTGRTEIWRQAFEEIQKSPVVGYGYCSARFIMEKYSFHCHNVILNALMYGGLFSGLLVTAMILYQLVHLFKTPRPEVDGLIVCLLLGGMVEELVSAASPSASLLLWFSLIFWRQLGMQIAKPQG
jgi:exopolysaccharide production protein ExoQ